MKQMKLIFRAIALILTMTAFLEAMAEEEICLVVTETSGGQTYFALGSSPEITISDDVFTVESEESSMAVALVDIDYYSFATREASMVGQAIAANGGKVAFSAGKAFVTGLKVGESVNVYTVDGRQMSATPASQNGEAMVDLSGLGAGAVYVLRTPSASYRITVK